MTSGFMELFPPVSPRSNLRYSPHRSRRGSLNTKSLSLEEQDSLSSSLPMPLSRDDLETLKSKEAQKGTFSLSLSPTQSTLNVNQGFRQRSASLCTPSKKSLLGLTKLSGKKTPEHSMSTEDFVHEMPVLSPTQSTLNVNQGFRQRSASLCVSSKKSLLGLTKLSGKKTPKHSIDTGKDINTHAIDNTLATIRNQLDQLCEEDLLIEERVNRLTSEITKLVLLSEQRKSQTANLLNQPQPYSGYKRTRSDEPCALKRIGGPDAPYGNIVLSELKETREELELERSYSGELEGLPFDLACREFEDSVKPKRDSLDSTGSTTSVTDSSSSGVCVVIVTDTTGNSVLGPVSSQTSGSSQLAEDDVFLLSQ